MSVVPLGAEMEYVLVGVLVDKLVRVLATQMEAEME